jgi:NAD(P)-dependent dehydrogenase (short-subunit alcohol dehydrogenase family)
MKKITWTLQNIPDQTGRVAIVTGATSGTGFETAKTLAGKGATVVLACRNHLKATEAVRRIQEAYPGAQVEVQMLDLGSLRSVRVAAAAIRERFSRLDLLINNAGLMIPPYGKTEDGFESQIGTNHFGPFTFTGLLLDRLLATPGSRIVTMSSGMHRMGRIDFEDLHSERRYRAWAAYGQSKLANLLFTYELQRRLRAAGSGALSLAAHPGWARTELQRHAKQSWWLGGLMSGFGSFLAQDALGGALPLLRAATDPSAKGGEYYGPSGFQEFKGDPVLVQSNPGSHDTDLQQRLWRCSELSTGVIYAM